jgi:hypothetical protein
MWKVRAKKMHKKSPWQQMILSGLPSKCSVGKMLVHFVLWVEQHRECQGDHFALTVSFCMDGKEEASMEKGGLGKFVQMALLRAKE